MGEDISKAKVLLEDAKLRLRTEAKSRGAKPRTIVGQNPKPDSRVAPGTIITAFVEPEPEMVSVPDVIGVPVKEVRQKLKDANLQLRTEAKSAGKDPGTIVDQKPKGDERVAPGTMITVFVEPEPEMVTVPDVFGVPVEQVAVDPKFQGKWGWRINAEWVITGKVPVGAIANQSPAASKSVPAWTTVTVAAEAYSVKVPKLIGKR